MPARLIPPTHGAPSARARIDQQQVATAPVITRLVLDHQRVSLTAREGELDHAAERSQLASIVFEVGRFVADGVLASKDVELSIGGVPRILAEFQREVRNPK